MTAYYISESDVLESIRYFKDLKIDNESDLITYLISRNRGISETRSITYQGGNSLEKEKVLEMIWLLGGLTGKNEIADKKCILFPNAFHHEEIKKGDFYQAGTPFKDLMSRTKDTIEKKNIHLQLYEDKNKHLTLKRDFKNKVSELLFGSKISLKHFACWVYRFVDFNSLDPNLDSTSFTRIVNKSIKRLFKLNKSDFTWLFSDDILKGSITPSTTCISAKTIRDQFSFQEQPEFQVNTTGQPLLTHNTSFDINTVAKFMSLSGNNPSDEQIYQTLLQKKQLVLTGVPGVGKSRFSNNLATKFHRSEMIQFHANYSYEEFIGGDTIENSSITSKIGTFLAFIQEAKSDPENDYLYIIDELNRGNIPQIFGETILTLDRGYEVKLSKTIQGISSIKIPDNLYIVCTMNSSDRNIAFIDLAIRRRFAFIELYPNDELVSALVEYDSYDMGSVLKVINNRILESLGREELLLGQAYFMSDTVYDGIKYIWNPQKWQLQFNYVILPTLKEYTFSNSNALSAIIGDQLMESILDLDEFVEAFDEAFYELKG